MPILTNTVVSELPLRGYHKGFHAYLGFCNVDHDRLLQTKNMYLHGHEQERYESIEAEAHKRSYLRGRYISKEVLGAYFEESELTQFNIVNGIFNQPIVEYKLGHNRTGVSISHNEEYGIGVAFSEEIPMAVDIERCSLSQKEIIKSQITNDEREMAADMPWQSTIAYTVLWTVKEAISKVIKTGLTIPLDVLKVGGFNANENHIVCSFENFTQYQTVSFRVKDHVCSMAMPLNAAGDSDIFEFIEQTLFNLKLQSV
ncbi:MAG: 4'-phosphopantetheinyl transferase superfamily protein [Bacteroidota bacterium]